MRNCLVLICICVVSVVALISNTHADWEKTFGGTDDDFGRSVAQTIEGDYIIAGTTRSSGDVEGDVHLIRADSSGNLVWERTFGGAGYDEAYSVVQTADGGYIIAGTTRSSGAGGHDMYLIKTDSSGNLVWEKTFGGTDDDFGYSVTQTSDGDYIIVGETSSFGAGQDDVYAVKTDPLGNLVWEKTFGGTDFDFGRSVAQTIEGDYIIAGGTNSSGAGQNDVYVVKTDPLGNLIWEKAIGAAGTESANSVVQSSDGGYAIAGFTVPHDTSDYDMYLVKTDSLGNVVWEQIFGGTGYDEAYSVTQTSDGGYAVAGLTNSFGAGQDDAYLVKTDPLGNLVWEEIFGGAGIDAGHSVIQSSDGSYAIAGATNSFGAGGYDIYLVNFQAVPLDTTVEIPDPNLEAAIREALGKATGDITEADLRSLTKLRAPSRGIVDLTGLEYCTNLETLFLAANEISDMSTVAGLTKLRTLDLAANEIRDMSAVAGLTNLTNLDLSTNRISDISAVAGLTDLTDLRLSNNQISDMSAVAGLTNLTGLDLSNNEIIDMSAVTGLTDLTYLDLSNNEIIDMSTVAGLTKLTGLELSNNEIIDMSSVAGLASLTELDLSNNRIGDMSAVVELANLGYLGVSHNQLGDMSAVAGLTNLTGLELSNNEIIDMSAVAGLTNLTNLDLSHNRIDNMGSVAGLTKLTSLDLSHNEIIDMRAAKALDLEVLRLDHNLIIDISALGRTSPSPNTNQTGSTNQLRNVSVAAAGMTSLIKLGLNGNRISDVTAVAGLVNLTELGLERNQISQLEPLVNNPGLDAGDIVQVSANPLNSLSLNTHIPALADRGVQVLHDPYSGSIQLVDQNPSGTWNYQLNHTSGDIYGWEYNGETITGASVSGDAQDAGWSVVTQTDTRVLFATSTPLVSGPMTGFHITGAGTGTGTSDTGTHQQDLDGPLSGELSTLTLHLNGGLNFIHIPLSVPAITTIADVYHALGGLQDTLMLIYFEPATGRFHSYSEPFNKPSDPVNALLTPHLGLIAVMKSGTTKQVQLEGTPYDSTSLTLVKGQSGLNLVGLPLNPDGAATHSDILKLGSSILAITGQNDTGNLVTYPPVDQSLRGGRSFIAIVREDVTLELPGTPWVDETSALASPRWHLSASANQAAAFVVEGRTVLRDSNSLVNGLNISVRNLATGASLNDSSGWSTHDGRFSLTFVDLESGRAVAPGDVLEIQVTDPTGRVSSRVIHQRVTVDDMLNGRRVLDPLLMETMPSETVLLPNYPNPFNPETWFPYELASDAEVSILIYNVQGYLVRQLDLGHQSAGFYVDRDTAAYWDGRNSTGEGVTSGLYFYRLTAGNFTSVRRMTILR